MQLARRGNGAPALGRDRRPRSSLAGEGFDECWCSPVAGEATAESHSDILHVSRLFDIVANAFHHVPEPEPSAIPKQRSLHYRVGCPGYWRYPEAFVGSR